MRLDKAWESRGDLTAKLASGSCESRRDSHGKCHPMDASGNHHPGVLRADLSIPGSIPIQQDPRRRGERGAGEGGEAKRRRSTGIDAKPSVLNVALWLPWLSLKGLLSISMALSHPLGDTVDDRDPTRVRDEDMAIEVRTFLNQTRSSTYSHLNVGKFLPEQLR